MVIHATRSARAIGVFYALAVFLAAGVNCRGQSYCYGFETKPEGAWQRPHNGGSTGGIGVSTFVSTGETDFARTGTQALRLMVYDEGGSNAMAWTGISEVLPCSSGQRLRVGAWLYYSSTVYPMLPEGASFQLRLEYFSDTEGRQINPHRVRMSNPFGPSNGHAPDEWHLVEICDRAPSNTKAFKFSLVLSTQNTDGCRQAVWADDVFIELSGSRPRNELIPRLIPSTAMATILDISPGPILDDAKP